MKRNTSLSYWPPFLHPIFHAVGKTMNGRQLHPNILKELPIVDDERLAGHRWELRHIAGEEATPGGNGYLIIISGSRVSGRWAFRSGELANLAREAVAQPNVG